jgi:hypothetical protein
MTIMQMQAKERRILEQCASRMIISGHWNDLSNSAIRDAFSTSPDSDYWFEQATRLRDAGWLEDMIHIHLEQLREVTDE